MKITIKKIAEVAGVSRGTVDRALNHRRGVNPEVAKRIIEIADQLGYQPDLAAKGLAAKRYAPKRIGILLCSGGNPFFDEVMEGIRDALDELKVFEVKSSMKFTKGFDLKDQLKKLDEFRQEGIDGLVLTPVYSELVAEKLKEMKREGITVVTINTDIDDSDRLAYVGCDYVKSGKAAAGLLGMMDSGKEERVILVVGSQMVLAQAERLKGIFDTLRDGYKNIRVTRIIENNEDDETSYRLIREALQEDPGLMGICFAGAGQEGGLRAIKESGRGGKLRVITYDLTEVVKGYLRDDVVFATVCQEPYKQGYLGVDILGKYLLTGKHPVEPCVYMHIYIATKYTV
ncbi:LacI family DNA-binding transcriptional regulator [Ruminococcus sp. OA3]|uniref:LacI family DNA-binding transcriptional regulator n=1 Tax=Ruminococcus sp. OA3 TaxID=2914164 RepID=UPI001F064C20|nr:LacI family DNA-binding transcriptional regulator [Ruminococcus sp. OA3]MCH1982426.1 LacI family DNA-binding transcriptional regulator [Ruminococcus sp. OA3]